VILLDEMGPVAAKSYPGQQLVCTEAQTEPQQPAQRAKQESGYGRRDKGYVFGAFRPATGEALTKTYQARSAVNWVDFLQEVEEWLPEKLACVYAIVDNLSTHRASDVLLFSLQHPRWEFVFQPKYAAYLNLLEPWWKILCSLALKGSCFETWPRSSNRLKPLQFIGTNIVIHLLGDDVADINPVVNRASPSCRKLHKLGGCTT
jgi:hypothetical protein